MHINSDNFLGIFIFHYSVPVGFILIHSVFVFICSSVGVEIGANCVLCVWPYKHHKSEHSAAGGVLLRKRCERISAVAMRLQHLSVQNRKEATFQGCFLSCGLRSIGLWFSVTAAQLILWHCALHFLKRHLQHNTSHLTLIDLFCGFRDITRALCAPAGCNSESANPFSGERCQQDARVCLI